MADDNTTAAARARMIQGFRNTSGRHGDWMARRNALLQRQTAQANPGQGQGPAATQGGPAANPGPEAFMGQARDMIAKGNVPPMVQGPGGPQFAPGLDRGKLQDTIQQSAGKAPEGARDQRPAPNTGARPAEAGGRMPAIPAEAQAAIDKLPAEIRDRVTAAMAGGAQGLPSQAQATAAQARAQAAGVPQQATDRLAAGGAADGGIGGLAGVQALGLADRARGIQAALGAGPAAMAPFASQPQATIPTLPAQAALQAPRFVAQPVAPQAALPAQAAPQAQIAVQTQPAAAPAAPALPQQAAPQAQVAVQAPQAQATAAQAQQTAAGQANAQVNQSAQLAAAVQAAQKPAAPPAPTAPAVAQPAAPAQPTQAQNAQVAQAQAQQAAPATPAAPAAPTAPVAQPAPAAPAAPAAPRLTTTVLPKDELTANQTSRNQLSMAGQAPTR